MVSTQSPVLHRREMRGNASIFDTVVSSEPWDLVRTASHGWALLADTAFAAGRIERAEELIALAYLSYDEACSRERAAELAEENDEISVTDITINGSSINDKNVDMGDGALLTQAQLWCQIADLWRATALDCPDPAVADICLTLADNADFAVAPADAKEAPPLTDRSSLPG